MTLVVKCHQAVKNLIMSDRFNIHVYVWRGSVMILPKCMSYDLRINHILEAEMNKCLYV